MSIHYTIVGDLLRFDQAVNGTDLLSKESKTFMWTPTVTDNGYAYGWGTGEYAGHRHVGQNRGTSGVSAEFRRFVDDHLTIIVLANCDEVAVDVGRELQAILFGQAYRMPTSADKDYRIGMTLQGGERWVEALGPKFRPARTDLERLLREGQEE